MFFGRNVSTNLYERAIDQFMVDVRFHVGEVRDFFIDLETAERMLLLSAFILILIYIIVARARRKYNPGSLGRQFIGAVLVLGVVLIGGDAVFGTGGGAYSGIFKI
ncbi:MAG: hypothetical protein ABJH52_13760 [Henriciella sp.]